MRARRRAVGRRAAGLYARVTAADVRDRPFLRAFVQRTVVLSAAYAFVDHRFRPEGEWMQGSIYLFVFQPDGCRST